MKSVVVDSIDQTGCLVSLPSSVL